MGNAQAQAPTAPALEKTPPDVRNPLVDLDARIKVESQSLGADGVTRTSQYEEIFMRRGTQVWMQRIRPHHAAEHDHAKETKGHKHLDPLAGGRLISLTDGKVEMQLVLDHEKQVVNIPPVEFGNVGFDGSWEGAYYLIAYKNFMRSKLFKVSTRKSPFPDAVWYEKKGDGHESVLWDSKRLVPRIIESSNPQGNQTRRITVTLTQDLARVVPWSPALIKSHDQLRYSDFMD